jgi:tetraacyldisaccharide 4'-kinase
MDRRIMFRNLGKFPYQNLYFTALKYGSPLPVFHGSAMTIENMETVRGNRVMLITGIANPLPLKEHLESLTAGVVHRAYPDHHNFTREDMANISRDRLFVGEGPFYIFTTEKDAVRLRMHTDLPEIIKGNLYFIPVEAEFLNDDALEFNNHIINYVRKNKGNRRIPG